MKKLVIGILAHVDAGKTTLSEAMLYISGKLKTLGRIDHGNAFLDTAELEKLRGITIFSKQAVFDWKNTEFTLLDTPGHVDFSAEMERTLQVLDSAILVINATDGIQGHTQTLWNLLKQHKIPTAIFINKMDLPNMGKENLLNELKTRFSDNCIDFTSENLFEQIAMCSDDVLDEYLNTNTISENQICDLIKNRGLFPCFFGSALSANGVDALLDSLNTYFYQPSYPTEFGAKIFKISRDNAGNRLTHVKITGGNLSVRTLLKSDDWEEKVNQIRLYSGDKFKTIDTAYAGQICTLTGLSMSASGEGLGIESKSKPPVLQPVLTYRVIIPQNSDAHTMLGYLKQLEEEDPMLHVVWNDKEIHVQLMGEVQLEILTEVLHERFGITTSFDTGHIVYRETIKKPVIGVGHFEPLRHYAEAHLLLEPLENGKGIQIDTKCSPDSLDINWQRLILTHVLETTHIGVLTGSPIADIKITLIAGKAHLKHTEGGDFRQATYRAIRQGLMQAENVLLEPYYSFTLEVPTEMVGRAMTDIQKMHGEFEPSDTGIGYTVLTGTVPVATMRNYQTELAAYTKGKGKLFCTLKGYYPCHNTDEVIEQIGYDAEHDTAHPADSVFCSHGAGFNVKWNEVAQYQHLHPEINLNPKKETQTTVHKSRYTSNATDKEIEEIFVKTYGEIKNRSYDAFHSSRKTPKRTDLSIETLSRIKADDYLLVDGYNIIFAWDELNEIAKDDLSAARSALIRILSNFQGMRKCRLILVFDAYKVKGNMGSIEKDGNIHVVYTKEAETADMYIEKASYDLSRKHRVRVATSDATEQMIILGHGAERLSANDLKWEVEQVNEQLSVIIQKLKN
ncbi:MAG TPA: TetM/TetW/TetO/TetS family tetracycline resistance ribosomal protection protein [Candidatus Butyricicoccus avistercoris]|uniref:TetM/TetW/TetO/TetS family tetracycline resistance ribosomal protection protein n=1 Tax=Candidatus Butyricicoccus avistercoris TaxID=2838518 RepID=A0A9D1PIY9_9FIRM|nr:TetM/TetW/TetO/TetS family tetracycline resistance ribosomal protection protein [Candidatus Butyricicoccus avistercoris]